jgi:DNA-binding transcriptional LysR family regulator
MNHNHLMIFAAVAHAGSFTRGAAALAISQPAVSKQIADLEASLGVTLLERLPRGARLTEAGRVLAEYAGRIRSLEYQAEQEMGEFAGLQRGHLAVGASTTIGAYLLPDILATFHSAHPQIELNLEIANTEVVERKLAEGVLDLALTEGPADPAHLDDLAFDARVIWQDELVVIAPPGHALGGRGDVTAGDIAAQPLILRESGSGTRAVIERALAAKGLHAVASMSLGGTEAIKRAVAGGAGLAIVSRLTIGLELETGRLIIVPLVDLTLRRPLHLLIPRGRHHSAPLRAFLGLLEQSLVGPMSDAAHRQGLPRTLPSADTAARHQKGGRRN